MAKQKIQPKSEKSSKKTTFIHSPLSEKEEEILEYIGKTYETNPENVIKRVDLAITLSCSPAMVNKVLKKLERKELIVHKKYGEITLTNEGFKYANALIRRHRLSEAFFVKLLGLDASEAHNFACKFEHILDEKLASRIEEILNFPEFCPHGNLIKIDSPNKDLHRRLPLTTFDVNELIEISQIIDEDSFFLMNLKKNDIEVGAKLLILKKSMLDETLLVEVHGKIFPLGKETAEKLWGFKIKADEE